MEILKSLGVNPTFWIQLVCFLVSFLSLRYLIFKPYSTALTERQNRTIGSEEMAVRLIEEANDLHSDFEKKARDLNSKIKGFYDQSRAEARREYDQLVESARKEAGSVLEEARAYISKEIASAQKALAAEAPAVGAVIATKLAGKDISL